MVLGGRTTLSRRDALLILIGATCMHLFSSVFPIAPSTESIIISSHIHEHSQFDLEPIRPPPDNHKNVGAGQQHQQIFQNQAPIEAETETITKTVLSAPTPLSPESFPSETLPFTSIVHHAPGWTIFRNLYMSNGTLLILSPEDPMARSKFPDFRMMTSTGLPATAGNEAAREPTQWDMGFISPADAKKRWGDVGKDGGNRVVVVDGSTALFNDPRQFLDHYYHLVAELFFGLQAFWHSAWAKPLSFYSSNDFVQWSSPSSSSSSRSSFQTNPFESSADPSYANWQSYDPAYNPHSAWNAVPLSASDYLPSHSIPHTSSHPALLSLNHPQSYLRKHPESPKIDRAIFMHATDEEWRDKPGFNAFFLRGAFPGMSVEGKEAWNDRVKATAMENGNLDRAFLFPIVVLVDRSAAFRGLMCGSRSQRTAAEAWEYMRGRGLLRGERVGGWWNEVRERMWKWVGVPVEEDPNVDRVREWVGASRLGDENLKDERNGEEKRVLELKKITQDLSLQVPAAPESKTVVTYLSRQPSARRKLTDEAHGELVKALEETCKKRGWEFVLMEPEKMGKDEQVRVVSRTTILISVHGNGLTHLLWMPPTRFSAVIEIFYPGGFAHDYHWTSRALGMSHFGVWGNKVGELGQDPGQVEKTQKIIVHPHEPSVEYPEGFQLNYIPVDGSVVAKLVEDRLDGKV